MKPALLKLDHHRIEWFPRLLHTNRRRYTLVDLEVEEDDDKNTNFIRQVISRCFDNNAIFDRIERESRLRPVLLVRLDPGTVHPMNNLNMFSSFSH